MARPLVLSLFAAMSMTTILAAPITRRASSASPLLSVAVQEQVHSRLAGSSNDTWTAGTYGEALLELYYPSLSVFAPSFATANSTYPTEVVSLVDSWAAKRPAWSKELAHVENGASGDPPALGVPWLVAATSEGGETKARLWEQAREQLEYLLETVPRTPDGAISHRPPSEKVQLWTDYMYMVPPFLAYYGVMAHNTSLIEEAYTQLKLYRNYLAADSSAALRHVVLGDWQDNGLWATGNGWAAAGMTRVLATMQHSQYAGQFANEIGDLKQWTKQLLQGSFSYLGQDGLLPNYFDVHSSFSDSAGSALLAASAFRLATLDSASSTDYSSILRSASTIRSTVNGNIQSSGWLSQVVDPLSFAQQAQTSPEGQAFVLLLQAAYRDFEASSN
ncbi:hypothetical protein JCM11491_003636 [Sporobolomyces phaffii]